MKNVAIVLLLLALLFIADRLVRIENQRYALFVGMCPVTPTDPAKQWDCLSKVQTRTSWLGHLYYGLTDTTPAVPWS